MLAWIFETVGFLAFIGLIHTLERVRQAHVDNTSKLGILIDLTEQQNQLLKKLVYKAPGMPIHKPDPANPFDIALSDPAGSLRQQ